MKKQNAEKEEKQGEALNEMFNENSGEGAEKKDGEAKPEEKKDGEKKEEEKKEEVKEEEKKEDEELSEKISDDSEFEVIDFDDLPEDVAEKCKLLEVEGYEDLLAAGEKDLCLMMAMSSVDARREDQ